MSAELDPHWRFADEAFRNGQRLERARRKAVEAQRSAAESFKKSVQRHVECATSYDEAAEFGGAWVNLRKHAARHREFARKDRRIAEQLRRMAEVQTN